MRIGLDIDGVLAGYIDGILERARLKGVPHLFPATRMEWTSHHAGDQLMYEQIWAEIKDDPSFWLGLRPLVRPEEIPFEVALYCTARPAPTRVSKAWLDGHGFPSAKVVTVPYGQSKVVPLAEHGIDHFIDDNVTNYQQINAGGVTVCHLWDTPANRDYVAPGTRRIFTFGAIKQVLAA